MIKAMIGEIELKKDYLGETKVSSIYFGGGTPSLLTEKELNEIFKAIIIHFNIDENPEITLEANPDDLITEKIEMLSMSPVNRLSIGVQTFNDSFLKWMNRAHNSKEALACLSKVKESDFKSINVDLIFGIPGMEIKNWNNDLDTLMQYTPEHLSLYNLTVEPGTALNHFVKKGKVNMPLDDSMVNQFRFARSYLKERGYHHYEISNYALPEYEAIHNGNYWKSVNYLGIGPSAHSYNGNSRAYNVSNNQKYMKGVEQKTSFYEVEELTESTKYNEYVMTRLRTSWGISESEIPNNLKSYYKAQLVTLLEKGWIIVDSGKVTLSEIGLSFADAAAMELFHLD